MTTLERELIEKIGQLDVEQQRQVFEFVNHLEQVPHERHYSALELMTLPPEERDRLVREAFTLAADEPFETFEAYNEQDFDTGY